MDDKQFAAEKKRVEKVLLKWAKALGLRHTWWMHYKWFRGPLPPYPDETTEYAAEAMMDCKVHWQYLKAFIRVNCEMTAEHDDEALEWAAVHELMHVFLREMREEGILHEERVASQLANAIIWLRDDVAKGKGPC